MTLHSPLIALGVLAIIFSGAILGMALARLAPSQHLTSDTRTVVTGSIAIVGTMSALVIGLLISSANTSFMACNNDVANLSTHIVRVDLLLRRYGLETIPARAALRNYTSTIFHDLFPPTQDGTRIVEDPAADQALDQVQALIISLKPTSDLQNWLKGQALGLAAEVSAARWLLAQHEISSFPLPFLGAVVLWLTFLFASYGFFAPLNATSVVAIFLCAFAVCTAVKLILDMDTPFAGGIYLESPPIHVSNVPLRRALELLGQQPHG
jgi:hypothetical protein